MDNLANLPPVIAANAAVLNQPGVIAVRPGYQIKDGWMTDQPAIVVVVDRNADAAPQLPANVGGIPIDIRRGTAIEQIRHDDPVGFDEAATRPEFGGSLAPAPAALAGTAPVAGVAAIGAAGAVAAAHPKVAVVYTPPAAPAALKRVTGKMRMILHASPDAGWPQLQKFFGQTQSTLTVGMYDFTSGHVLKTLDDLISARPGASVKLTLDSPPLNPPANQTDVEAVQQLRHDLAARFVSAWAPVRTRATITNWIFPNAYHIKTAIRDSSVVWLSSGNWNNTNQPDFDPVQQPRNNNDEIAAKSDRDWHVIVENQELATMLETFVEHDFDVASAQLPPDPPPGAGPVSKIASELAGVDLQFKTPGCWRFFSPLDITEEVSITPLLTPDTGAASYASKMLALLGSAAQTLYIQLQYIHPADPDPAFQALISAVAQKIVAGVDVRIILSQYQLEASGKNKPTYLEQLQAAGVSAKNVKIQNRVHNKGFLIDGNVTVVGSHNWSGDGVLRNRDASLIIENQSVTKYFEQIFLHDWKSLARKTMTPNAP